MILRHALRNLAVPALLLTAACGDDDSGTDTAADTASDATAADGAGDSGGTDAAPTDAAATETDDDAAATDATTSDASDTAEVSDPSYGFAIVDLPAPVDITPDGAFAVFWNSAAPAGDTHLYDVNTKALSLLTQVGSPARDFPTAVSNDLRLTALYGEPVHAGLWTGSEWRRLGSVFGDGCGEDVSDPKLGDIGAAWDLSSDGEIVVGMLWDDCDAVAFRWSEDGETRDFRTLAVLGAVPEGATAAPVNRATVVSDDGLVAGGFAQTALVDRWPALWRTDDGTGQLLVTEVFPADAPGEILAIEADGTLAAGTWNQRGFVWSAAEGVVDIGALPDVLPGESTFANAVAANGTLVFGASGGPFLGIQQAFVWTSAKGMRKLADVARAHGLTIAEDTILNNVLGASADGAVVIGTLTDVTFAQKSFVLRLPAAAYAD